MVKVKTKQAKENKTVRGEGTVAAISFEAVDGATVKGVLKGDGLETWAMLLVGPEGTNPYEFAGSGRKVKVAPVVLQRGMGTYEIRFDAPVTVAWKLKVKPPPKTKGAVPK